MEFGANEHIGYERSTFESSHVFHVWINLGDVNNVGDDVKIDVCGHQTSSSAIVICIR